MTFVLLPFSVRSLDLSCCFTRAHEGFMMCNKEVASRIEQLDRAVTNFYFMSQVRMVSAVICTSPRRV